MEILKHNIKTNIPLKDHSTFRIGGPAKFFVEVDDLQRLANVLNWAQDHQQKVFVLGGGSNVLFMDDGFDGLIIKLINKDVKTEIVAGDGITIRCGAGLSLARLVSQSFKVGAIGLEWAVGIPGTVGGAVRGNAGAFGGEMKDVVKEVQAINFNTCRLDLKKQFNDVVIQPNQLKKNIEYACRNIIQKFNNKECEFGYRNSIFKKIPGLTIWEIEIKLSADKNEKAKEMAKNLLSKRQQKQPPITKFPSAGSVFKNPKVPSEVIRKFEHDQETKSRQGKVPAGWLIARAGLLGKKIGGAMVSKDHGNFIVNTGNATAQDVLLLISIIKTLVRNKYNVHLQEEICVIH